MNRQTEKKELIYWLISNGGRFPYKKFFETEALDFDPKDINSYLVELIDNPENCELLHDAIDCLYDDMCSADKALWKKHVAEIDCLIANPSLLDADTDENIDCE